MGDQTPEAQNPQAKDLASELSRTPPPAHVAEVPGSVVQALNNLKNNVVEIPDTVITAPAADSGGGGSLQYGGETNPDWIPQHQDQGENPGDPNGARRNQHGRDEDQLPEDKTPLNPASSSPNTNANPSSGSGYRLNLPIVLKQEDPSSIIIARIKGAIQRIFRRPNQPALPPDEFTSSEKSASSSGPLPPITPAEVTAELQQKNQENQAHLDRVRYGHTGKPPRLDRS